MRNDAGWHPNGSQMIRKSGQQRHLNWNRKNCTFFVHWCSWCFANESSHRKVAKHHQSQKCGQVQNSFENGWQNVTQIYGKWIPDLNNKQCWETIQKTSKHVQNTTPESGKKGEGISGAAPPGLPLVAQTCFWKLEMAAQRSQNTSNDREMHK